VLVEEDWAGEEVEDTGAGDVAGGGLGIEEDG
jgi:hypothetical protein